MCPAGGSTPGWGGMEGKGLNHLLDKGNYQYKDVQLLDFKSLGGGVVQLHFAVGHE